MREARVHAWRIGKTACFALVAGCGAGNSAVLTNKAVAADVLARVVAWHAVGTVLPLRARGARRLARLLLIIPGGTLSASLVRARGAVERAGSAVLAPLLKSRGQLISTDSARLDQRGAGALVREPASRGLDRDGGDGRAGAGATAAIAQFNAERTVPRI